MKKALMIGLIAAGNLLPTLSNADGLAIRGYVNVTNSTTGTSYMYGTMNNRYNTSPTTAETYIFATAVATGAITFGGRDGDGDFFSCNVPSSSALHSAATAIKNGMSNGTFIYVTKSSSSSECAYLSEGKYSYFQD